MSAFLSLARRDLHRWDRLVEGPGNAGWIVLALVATTLAAVGFALVAAPRIRSGRWRFAVLAPPVLLTLQSLGLLAGLVTFERSRAFEWALHGAPSGWSCACRPAPISPARAELAWLGLFSVVLTLAVPGVLLAFSRIVRSRSRRALLRALGVVALATGAAASWVLADTWLEPPADPELVAAFREGLGGAIRVVDAAALATPVLACLGLCVVLLRRWRTREPITRSWVGLLGPAGVFALGALAFAATRGHATDRHHPVSLRGTGPVYDHAPAAPAWVDLERCREARAPMPIVTLRESDIVLDGRRVGLGGVFADLTTMRRNWSVLHPREPHLLRVALVAPIDTPMPRLQPVRPEGDLRRRLPRRVLRPLGGARHARGDARRGGVPRSLHAERRPRVVWARLVPASGAGRAPADPRRRAPRDP